MSKAQHSLREISKLLNPREQNGQTSDKKAPTSPVPQPMRPFGHLLTKDTVFSLSALPCGIYPLCRGGFCCIMNKIQINRQLFSAIMGLPAAPMIFFDRRILFL